MYHMPHFKADHPEEIFDFMKQYPLAIISSVDHNNQIQATHVPVIVDQLEDKVVLSGHLMRNTPHFKTFETNDEVLVIFNGPNAYVSASWYQQPQQGSTWNYITVHCRGKMKLMNTDRFPSFMQRFTSYFEGNSDNSPTVFNNLPESYTSQMMPHIVGFEIEVYALENVFKLSQNRDEESYDNIIEKLQSRDSFSTQVASEMMKRKNKVFQR